MSEVRVDIKVIRRRALAGAAASERDELITHTSHYDKLRTIIVLNTNEHDWNDSISAALEQKSTTD